MGIKLTQKDFELVDKVLDDFSKNNNNIEMCPYCNTKIDVELKDGITTVKCQSNECFQETFKGV
jgi:hypothetical protein